MKNKLFRRGFTLMEVMISIAILALGMATIFGSTVIASRGAMRARNITNASLIARCRMVEIEAYLKVNQLPETDVVLDDPPDTSVGSAERCCDLPFTCVARVDRIELPQPADIGSAAGDRMLNSAATAVQGTSFGGDGGVGGPAGGAIGQLAAAFGMMSGAGGTSGSGASGLSSSGAPNPMSLTSQLLGGIYPTIKPLLEGAIRKVTVTVSWREGVRTQSFDVIQYVTNPGQTMMGGDQMNQLNNMLNGGRDAGVAH